MTALRPDCLASAVLARDPDAVGPWFEAEHPQVWKLCFGMLADDAEADEAAQDAMLHLHDHLDSWSPDKAYAPWRNAVVTNLCRDRLRRVRARRRNETRAAEQRGLPDRLPAPEDRARRTELRELLRQALSILSPREREVFVLRDLEQRSTLEVAATLSIGESSVRSLSSLARGRLRRLLAARLPGLAADLEGGRA